MTNIRLTNQNASLPHPIGMTGGPLSAKPAPAYAPRRKGTTTAPTIARPTYAGVFSARLSPEAVRKEQVKSVTVTLPTKADLENAHKKPKNENIISSGRVILRLYGNTHIDTKKAFKALGTLLEKGELKHPLKLNVVVGYFLSHRAEILRSQKDGTKIIFHVDPQGYLAVPQWNLGHSPVDLFSSSLSYSPKLTLDTRLTDIEFPYKDILVSKLESNNIETFRDILLAGRKAIKAGFGDKPTFLLKALETLMAHAGFDWEFPVEKPSPLRPLPTGIRTNFNINISENLTLLRTRAKRQASLIPLTQCVERIKKTLLSPDYHESECPIVSDSRSRAAFHLQLLLQEVPSTERVEDAIKVASLIYREASITISSRIVEDQVERYLRGESVLELGNIGFPEKKEREQARAYHDRIRAGAEASTSYSEGQRQSLSMRKDALGPRKDEIVRRLRGNSIIKRDIKDALSAHLETTLEPLRSKKMIGDTFDTALSVIEKNFSHVEKLLDWIDSNKNILTPPTIETLNERLNTVFNPSQKVCDFSEIPAILADLDTALAGVKTALEKAIRDASILASLSSRASAGFKKLRKFPYARPEVLAARLDKENQPHLKDEIFCLVAEAYDAGVIGIERLFTHEKEGFLSEKSSGLSGAKNELTQALTYARDRQVKSVVLANFHPISWILSHEERALIEKLRPHFRDGKIPYSKKAGVDIEYVTHDGERVLVETKTRNKKFQPKDMTEKAQILFQIFRYIALVRTLDKKGAPVEFRYVVHSPERISDSFQSEITSILSRANINCRLVRVDTDHVEHEILKIALETAPADEDQIDEGPSHTPEDRSPPRRSKKQTPRAKKITIGTQYRQESIDLVDRWTGLALDRNSPMAVAFSAIHKHLNNEDRKRELKGSILKNITDILNSSPKKEDAGVKNIMAEIRRILRRRDNYSQNLIENLLRLAGTLLSD